MIASSRSRLPGALGVLAFICLLWLIPVATSSLGHQNDIPVHLRWAEQFLAALREGWILPRWAHASRYGLGDPTFVYYQPLLYYFSSAFALLGARAETALLLAAAMPYVLLGGFTYFGVLRSYPSRNALLGTLFVVGCPLLYFLSTYMAGFPWTLSIPFSVLFIAESTRDRPRPPYLALLLCFVCLSHLLSGLMTLLCTGLGRLVFAFPNRRTLPGHLAWAAGVVLGLALAAFFVYPAVTQLALITPTGWTQGNGFDWRKCFIFPTFTALRHGLHWFAIQWPLALLALAMAVMSLLQYANRNNNPAQVRACRIAVVALAAVVFSTELAYPLYAHLAPMQKLQFPYRFIFLACILGNVAFVIHLNEGVWARWGKLARTAAVLLVAAQCAQLALLEWNMARNGERLLTREAFMQGKFGQPEYLPAVAGPHWEAWVKDGKLAGECRRLAIDCADVRQRTHDLSLTVTAPAATSLRLPVFAYPAWQVEVDGRAQALHADPDTGLVLVALAPGRHAVTLAWSRLPAEVTGLWISALALCLMLALFVLERRRRPAAIAGQAHAGSAPAKRV
jgi:hypothetical protein